ncbi:MAG: hypothetical protein IPO81_12135 [Kouleothrix sp.]|nr:hypothetical protein [Kouleothrix sp.]
MSYQYDRPYRRPPERPRRRGLGCLAWLVLLVWVLLLALLAYRFWLRPQVSQYIGQQIGEQLRSNVGAQTNQQIEQGAAAALPTAIAALPSGEVRVSEAQANEYLAAHADSLKPVESAQVHFVPGEVQTDLRAFGTISTARMGLAVQNGRIIAVNPRLDGPLGQLVALPDLTSALERQLNDQLAIQGRRITNVEVGEGELVITIEK